MKELLLAAIATKNIVLNILALYGFFVLFTLPFLLPALLGWEPEINGIIHHFETDIFFQTDTIVIWSICSLLAVKVAFKGFFPVLALKRLNDNLTSIDTER